MKKITFIIAVFILATMFVACKNTKAPTVATDIHEQSAYFIAKVVTPREKSILVKVTDAGNSNISLGSEAWISSHKESNIDYNDYAVGDYVRIEFDGVVLESYPLQINSVTEITINNDLPNEYEAITVKELPKGFIALSQVDFSNANLEYVFWERQISFISTVDNSCVYQTDINNNDFIVKYNNSYYFNEKTYADILDTVNND